MGTQTIKTNQFTYWTGSYYTSLGELTLQVIDSPQIASGTSYITINFNFKMIVGGSWTLEMVPPNISANGWSLEKSSFSKKTFTSGVAQSFGQITGTIRCKDDGTVPSLTINFSNASNIFKSNPIIQAIGFTSLSGVSYSPAAKIPTSGNYSSNLGAFSITFSNFQKVDRQNTISTSSSSAQFPRGNVSILIDKKNTDSKTKLEWKVGNYSGLITESSGISGSSYLWTFESSSIYSYLSEIISQAGQGSSVNCTITAKTIINGTELRTTSQATLILQIDSSIGPEIQIINISADNSNIHPGIQDIVGSRALLSYSTIVLQFSITTQYGATLSSYQVVGASSVTEDDNIYEARIPFNSPLIEIRATDSRNITSTTFISVLEELSNPIQYFKPTLNITKVARIGETSPQVSAIISGNFFGGSIGKSSSPRNNALVDFQYAITDTTESPQSWSPISGTISYESGTFTVTQSGQASGYESTSYFHVRLKDTITNAGGEPYLYTYAQIKPGVPTFEWGYDQNNTVDFRFNVPVNFTSKEIQESAINTTMYPGVYVVKNGQSLVGQLLVYGDYNNTLVQQLVTDTTYQIRRGTAQGWSSWINFLPPGNGYVALNSSNRVNEPQQICSEILQLSAGTYNLGAQHCGKVLIINQQSNVTINFPRYTDSSIPDGMEFEIINWGVYNATGQITIAVPSNVWVHSPGIGRSDNTTFKIGGFWSCYSCKRLNSQTWILTGDL